MATFFAHNIWKIHVEDRLAPILVITRIAFIQAEQLEEWGGFLTNLNCSGYLETKKRRKPHNQENLKNIASRLQSSSLELFHDVC